MYENIATVIGRVATDVSTHRFDDGALKATFRLASTERRRDWSTGEWVDGDKLFLTVICWRALAENVRTSLRKGDPVMVRGRMHTREYESEGRKGAVVEMDATAVGPDLSWCTTALTRTSRSAARPAETAPEAGVAATADTERELVGAGAGGRGGGEVPVSA